MKVEILNPSDCSFAATARCVAASPRPIGLGRKTDDTIPYTR